MMFVGIFAVLLYVLCLVGGVGFVVFLIIAINKMITLKQEQNALLKEMIQAIKEDQPKG